MTDISIIIPSRNEMFLKNTIDDLLAHCHSDYEVIAVLDGQWADPPIPDHPSVTLIYRPTSIGQRAACNEAARMARGKYIMKVDAHCAFDDGFDVKLLADMQPDWTVAPLMRNLHAFDWVCPNGHRRYQGPSGPCRECGAPTERDVVWIAKTSPSSTSYCFDTEPHFQYFGEFKKRPEGRGDITETMSLQGSCFMASRDKYFELNLCDEAWGSWGSQGIEVACKTWLSGGKVICNQKTWYAHMFRTQGGDFGFPYPNSGRQIDHAKKSARQLFFENSWPKQVHPLSWLVERFWPVPFWKDADLENLKRSEDGKFGKVEDNRPAVQERQTAPPVVESGVLHRRVGKSGGVGIVYYTDCRLDQTIMQTCQRHILQNINGHRLVSVSLKPIDFGENIVIQAERGYLTMFRQILAGLEAIDAEIVFLAEHDVLYAPGYFDFVPPDKDKFYYNTNVWHVRSSDGHALYYTAKRLSQICAYRDVLLGHFQRRVDNTEAKFKELGDCREYRNWIRRQGFEPGTHNRSERVDDLQSDVWIAKIPNLDIKHECNLTPARWSQDQFRDQRNCRDWRESDHVDGWYVAGKLEELLK